MVSRLNLVDWFCKLPLESYLLHHFYRFHLQLAFHSCICTRNKMVRDRSQSTQFEHNTSQAARWEAQTACNKDTNARSDALSAKLAALQADPVAYACRIRPHSDSTSQEDFQLPQ